MVLSAEGFLALFKSLSLSESTSTTTSPRSPTRRWKTSRRLCTLSLAESLPDKQHCLHYRFASYSRALKNAIGFSIPDPAATAAKLRQMCPSLAERGATDDQLIEALLAAAEAMFCTTDRNYRLNPVLTERLNHLLGPASAEVCQAKAKTKSGLLMSSTRVFCELQRELPVAAASVD